MELRVLKYFLAVAQEENITKAAALLHITQPTLSRQLKELEEELGVSLFERKSHQITLTSEGLLLKHRAEEMVALEEKTKQEFLQESVLSGQIVIASGEFKCFSLVSEVIVSFHQMYPNVTFRIMTGNADYVKEKIESGIADFGVVTEPVDISHYEFIYLPDKEEWGFQVPVTSSLAKKECIRPKDIINLDLLAAERDLNQKNLAKWAGVPYSKLHIIEQHNLASNTAWLVEKGMGISFTENHGVEYKNLKFIPCDPPLETRVAFIWKSGIVMSRENKAFEQHVMKCLKGIS